MIVRSSGQVAARGLNARAFKELRVLPERLVGRTVAATLSKPWLSGDSSRKPHERGAGAARSLGQRDASVAPIVRPAPTLNPEGPI